MISKSRTTSSAKVKMENPTYKPKIPPIAPKSVGIYGKEKKGHPLAYKSRVNDKPIILDCETLRRKYYIFISQTWHRPKIGFRVIKPSSFIKKLCQFLSISANITQQAYTSIFSKQSPAVDPCKCLPKQHVRFPRELTAAPWCPHRFSAPFNISGWLRARSGYSVLI